MRYKHHSNEQAMYYDVTVLTCESNSRLLLARVADFSPPLLFEPRGTCRYKSAEVKVTKQAAKATARKFLIRKT